MKPTLTILLTAAAVCAIPALAADPLSTEVKQYYTSVKNNLLKAAEKMPAEDYNYKASPDIRTFGALIGHIADAQVGLCSPVNGAQKKPSAGSLTAKADLVAALKASNEECDKAFDALTDANASDMIKSARGERSRLGSLTFVVIHDNEEYGYLAVYMRTKGLVPPSSEKR